MIQITELNSKCIIKKQEQNFIQPEKKSIQTENISFMKKQHEIFERESVFIFQVLLEF